METRPGPGWLQLSYEDQDDLFSGLAQYVEQFGWELTQRDPGPPSYFGDEADQMAKESPTQADLDRDQDRWAQWR